jgi:hypothetical protein
MYGTGPAVAWLPEHGYGPVVSGASYPYRPGRPPAPGPRLAPDLGLAPVVHLRRRPRPHLSHAAQAAFRVQGQVSESIVLRSSISWQFLSGALDLQAKPPAYTSLDGSALELHCESPPQARIAAPGSSRGRPAAHKEFAKSEFSSSIRNKCPGLEVQGIIALMLNSPSGGHPEPSAFPPGSHPLLFFWRSAG